MKWMSLCRGLLFAGLAVMLFGAGNGYAQQPEYDPFAKENELKPPAKIATKPTQPAKPATTEGPPPTKNKQYLKAVPTASVVIAPASARPGETVNWTLTLNLAKGWHTYPTHQEAQAVESSRTAFSFPQDESVVFVGPLIEPSPLSKEELGLEGLGLSTKMLYLEGQVVFQRKLVVRPQAKPGSIKVPVTVTSLCCDERSCLPLEKLIFQAPLTISAEPPVPVEEKYRKEVETATVEIPLAPPISSSGPPASADSDLFSFLLTGIFWGTVSLLTPCVFPMIPITVSYFLKQSEKEHHRPFSTAVVYSLTIVVVLTLGAVLLLGVFQAASQHWLTNLVLGALFVFFALSLFGMYEITLPSSLARFTSLRQGQGGTTGTIFMALTFSIISFSCVAPFMGGFAALVRSFGNVLDMIKVGDLAHLLRLFGTLFLGALAFSVTFASPFFFLALFPSLVRRLPKSGSWMNTIKVVMGFLELAAAVKFLRATELLAFGQGQLLTYDLALGLYVALCLVCGLYLLGLFRLPHDDPAEHLGVLRMLFGVLFLGLALYLVPALFSIDSEQKQRPRGTVFAWIDSFLLPDPANQSSDRSAKEVKQANPHIGSLPEGVKLAQERHTLVFLDFTGLS